MSNTVEKKTRITDYNSKCRDCGAPLTHPETMIIYWNYVSNDGTTGRTTSEKGISEINVNAGLCEACQVKKLRHELETRSRAAETKDTGAPGTGAVALCGIGIFVSLLLLMLRVTRVDQYGNPVPIFTTWFFIYAGLLLASVIGLPIAISRRKKLCAEAVSSIGEDLKLPDGELLKKYAVMDGVPFMKKAWSDYMVKQTLRGSGGLVYASEILSMGSTEEVMKKCHVPQDLALQLQSTAKSYGYRAL